MQNEKRELLIRAIGMLEGASWLSDKGAGEMMDEVAALIRKAIGMEEKSE